MKEFLHMKITDRYGGKILENHFIIMITIIVFFCTCSTDHNREVWLWQAEKILNTQPDSSLHMLKNMQQPSSKRLLMWYNLLLNDANFRTGQSLADDETLTNVANYYQQYGHVNKEIRALYLLGNVFYEQGNYVLVLDCYQQAIAASDTTFADCDFHTLTEIKNNMSELYNKNKITKQDLATLDYIQDQRSKYMDRIRLLTVQSNLMLTLFAILLLIGILAALYWNKMKARETMQYEIMTKLENTIASAIVTENDLIKLKSSLQQLFLQNQISHEQLKEKIFLFIKEKESILEQQKKYVETIMFEENYSNLLSSEERMKKVLKELKIHNRIKPLTEIEWQFLKKEIELYEPTFFASLKTFSTASELTERERRIILLTRLHIKPKNVAILMELTPQNLSNIRRNINRKLFDHDTSSNIEKDIFSLE